MAHNDEFLVIHQKSGLIIWNLTDFSIKTLRLEANEIYGISFDNEVIFYSMFSIWKFYLNTNAKARLIINDSYIRPDFCETYFDQYLVTGDSLLSLSSLQNKRLFSSKESKNFINKSQTIIACINEKKLNLYEFSSLDLIKSFDFENVISSFQQPKINKILFGS